MRIKGKEKKEKLKYNTVQNIKYIISTAWRYNKSVFIYFGIYTVFASISPFISLFFPKFIIDELSALQRPKMLATLIICFFIFSSITGYLTEYLKEAYYPKMIMIRFKFLVACERKCMITGFKNTENPKFLNDFETSKRAVRYNFSGIEGVLHKLFSLGGSIITLVFYIVIVITLPTI